MITLDTTAGTEVPDPNKLSEEEAGKLIETFAVKFTTPAARNAMVALLTQDKAAGEDILRGLCGGADSGLTRAEAWDLVKKSAGCFSSHEAMQRVAELLVRDKAAGEALLTGLQKLPPKKAVELPPPPQHDPAQGPISPEQLAAAAAELIKAVQKEGKFKDYTSARDEARRRNPALFS